ncbi:MAG: L,D-transpeptidase [Nitrospirales bacterium]
MMLVSLTLVFSLLLAFTLPVPTADTTTLITVDHENLAYNDRQNHESLEHLASAPKNRSHPTRVHRQSRFPHHPLPVDKAEGEIYLLVDTSQHRLFVKQDDRILYSAIASTGSGNLLIDPQDPNRRWTFQTPKGEFKVLHKMKDPVWRRPDWAFIEQNAPIPEKMSERLQPGVLGSYALGFGNGYFIHGALYLNLLGQSVTHGCIQLHPEDLQFVFDTVPLGTSLIII